METLSSVLLPWREEEVEEGTILFRLWERVGVRVNNPLPKVARQNDNEVDSPSSSSVLPIHRRFYPTCLFYLCFPLSCLG